MFDFQAVMSSEIEENPSADPADVADAILRQIPAKELRAVLAIVLPSFVRTRVALRRNDRGKTPGTGKSWKVAGAAEAWRRHMTDRYNVGDHKWKLLAEMTFDDLMFSAEYREQQAIANHVQAERLRSWAELLLQHGAPTFGDLPEDVQQAAIEGNGEEKAS